MLSSKFAEWCSKFHFKITWYWWFSQYLPVLQRDEKNENKHNATENKIIRNSFHIKFRKEKEDEENFSYDHEESAIMSCAVSGDNTLTSCSTADGVCKVIKI